MADLLDLQVVLAADVVYDDDLTEALMLCMESFLKPDPARPGNVSGTAHPRLHL